MFIITIILALIIIYLLHLLHKKRSVEDVIPHIAHELKNPVSCILGYSNILLDPSSDSDTKRFAAEVINRSGKNQLKLIDSMLDFFRLETEKAPLEKDRFLFRELVEELRNEFLVTINKKGLDLHIINGHKNYVYADRARIYQVFSNLVSNAIKYTSNGSITIDIYEHKNSLRVEVSDTGSGIKNTKNIFKPFKQDHQGEGLGLGLYIAKRIIDLHKGSIDVESSRAGTSFIVSLPLDNS